MSGSRFVVGIDLGTTNTVLSYIDTREAQGDAPPAVHMLPIPQVVAPAAVEPRDTLPSFVYLAAGPELPDGALDLPWASGRSYGVGALARDLGANAPQRLVASAKSWLCHPGVDRTAPILPWGADDEVPKISPLDASVMVLEHLRDAWNASIGASSPEDALQQQEVLLTVPASFDAVARELTMTAAHRAGLTAVTLLEEPQAAFYAWLSQQGDAWREALHVGDMVLVCDVGGGTTDFTLIAVKEQQGDLVLERVAVGDHILLGGDNMDLALALVVAERLRGSGHNLDGWQTRALWYACRQAKERLLTQHELGAAPVTVLGRGSRVIGGSIKTELTRADLEQGLLEGFLPGCGPDDRPARGRRGGLQEIGLPYASDAAITRHLAKFLGEHGSSGEQVQPTAILYNGGVMKADPLRQRVTQVVDGWLSQAGRTPLKQLPSGSLDLAVAHGAAYYGMVRRGRGIRIRGGVGRSYYIGIESAMPAVPGLPAPLKALCVVPFGMEEGTEETISGQRFGMVVGEPVEFRFLSSTHRKQDAIGTMIERWPEGEIEELVPIHTAMHDDRDPSGTLIPVTLGARVTEIGTLDLQLHAADGRSWKLEYEIREKKPD